MNPTIEQRVARGTAWLDQVRPGWRDAVEPAALQMYSACHCICGQVFAEASSDHNVSGFDWAVEVYGADPGDWAAEHGFAIYVEQMGSEDSRPLWRELEEAWYRVLGVPADSLLVTHV